MRPLSPPFARPVLLLCVGALGCLGVLRDAQAASAAGAANASVEQARQLLAEGQAARALTVAREAVTRAPQDYKAHYVLAFALMELGELAAAEDAARQSLALAGNPQARDAAGQLVQQIAGSRAWAEAEAARTQGLSHKAIGLYRKAFATGSLKPDQVLAAAAFLESRHIVFNDLDSTQDWVRMLRSVAAGPDAMPETQRARKLVGRVWTFDIAVRWAYWQRAFEASSLPLDDPRRDQAWQLAIELWPTHRLAPLMAANDAARRQDWAALSPRLAALRQAQMLLPALRAGQLALGAWQDHAELLALLTDMLGPAQARRSLSANAATDPVLVADLPQAVPLPRAVIQLNDRGSGRSAKLVLDGLAMTETEVTEAQWQACVDWQGCQPLEAAHPRGPAFPVAGVPSTRVRDYPRWLSAMTGQRWRLPTAIEWHFAANTQGGDVAGDRALQAHVGGAEGPKPVRSYPPNPLGLYDMLGNVAEYAQPCTVQAADAAGGPPRVACDAPNVRLELRGGSWLSPAGSVDPARAELEPTFEDILRNGTPPTAGLRLVREAGG